MPATMLQYGAAIWMERRGDSSRRSRAMNLAVVFQPTVRNAETIIAASAAIERNADVSRR